VTVLIGMFLVGLLIAFGTWARSWSDHTKDKLVVKTFFCTESTCDKGAATPKQIDQVRVLLESNPQVKTATFVSKEVALERMRKQNPELVQDLAYNPLPDAYEVQPVKGEYTKGIADSVEQANAGKRPAGVEKVTYGEKTANRILKVARVIEALFLLAVAILLAASALLIANTIRLSIFSRRREIEVMKLVGATNWFVRGPFMLEGLICGLVGALCAVMLPQILGHIDDGEDVQAISFGLNALIVIAIGLLLGAAGSGLTIRRFLKV
jgi:cell division transport system permease protein